MDHLETVLLSMNEHHWVESKICQHNDVRISMWSSNLHLSIVSLVKLNKQAFLYGVIRLWMELKIICQPLNLFCIKFFYTWSGHPLMKLWSYNLEVQYINLKGWIIPFVFVSLFLSNKPIWNKKKWVDISLSSVTLPMNISLMIAV